MTAKTPTPQGISHLLKLAGFDRAVRATQSGARHARSGFMVSKDLRRDGAVMVRHSFLLRSTPEQHAAKLAAYAKTITEAGWTVEAGTYELIVTAKEGDGR